MSDKLKVFMVNYTNTLPFLYGFKHSPDAALFDLIPENPAQCARSYEKEPQSIALVPVAYLYGKSDYTIISNYCIGTKDNVRTVRILANKSISQLDKVYLDNHSISSANLLKILMRDHWKNDVEFVQRDVASEGVEIEENSGILLIGDKVFDHEGEFAFQYDLGAHWKKMTDLPFTFAVWISAKEFDRKYMDALNNVLSYGIQRIEDVISELDSSKIDYAKYLKEHIDYHFTPKKQKAMFHFLDRMGHNKL